MKNEEILEKLLWFLWIKEKNSGSGFWENEETGELHPFNPKLISSIQLKDTYKELGWKDLSLKLGLNKQYLENDGHDCNICPLNKTCNAYFKYNQEQPRCSGWEGL